MMKTGLPELLLDRLRYYRDNVMKTYTGRYEDCADRFYQVTGMWAPGKSQPIDCHTDIGVREDQWAEFQVAEKTQFLHDLSYAIGALSEHHSRVQ